jgi:hypothetical protein
VSATTSQRLEERSPGVAIADASVIKIEDE